jgi:hypothetical protein
VREDHGIDQADAPSEPGGTDVMPRSRSARGKNKSAIDSTPTPNRSWRKNDRSAAVMNPPAILSSANSDEILHRMPRVSGDIRLPVATCAVSTFDDKRQYASAGSNDSTA